MAMNINETVKKCNVCGKQKTTVYKPDYLILNDSCFRHPKAIFICEECAELIQAISKAKRGKFNEDNMMEEIADVLICIEMLKQIYNIPDYSIKNWIERKQERMLRRMEV